MFLARLAVHPDQMPATFKLFAIELEVEMALLQAPVRIADRRPRPLVPYDDRAAAVFALGDRALEIGVFQRMVFDSDGKALFARNEARATCYRPALQHAVESQPEIVVQPGRVMLLHDKEIALRDRRGALGLRRRREIALPAIGFERHSQPALRRAAAGLAFAAARRPVFFLAAVLPLGRFGRGGGALPQRLHKVDGHFTLWRRALRDRLALELQLDQLGKRILVAILNSPGSNSPCLVLMMWAARSSISPVIAVAGISENACAAERTS